MTAANRRKFFWLFLRSIVIIFASTAAIWVGVVLLFTAFGLAAAWHPLVRGVAELWISLVVAMGGAFLASRLFRRHHVDVFGLLNEAVGRIGRGDFSVQVPLDKVHSGGPEQPFQQLAVNFNAMTESLARIEELRRQFVSDVSHEFQSPLTSVLGFAQALRGQDLPEEQRQRYLGIIETEARRLSRLADTLLKLNALEDREGPPEPIWFRFDVQLRRVLVALEPQWAAKNLEIEADLFEVEGMGNEELWTQVWTNLLHNAIKFTPAGGRITVRLTGAGPWTVEIEDTGIGLAPGEVGRVFERFYKAESARSHSEASPGSGLGLALVHRIVILHGGSVEAASPGLGKGTIVRVSLPLVPGSLQ